MTKSVRVIWFDPGSTTGIFHCRVTVDWLSGVGSPDWEGLGEAINYPRYGQVGDKPRTVISGTVRGEILKVSNQDPFDGFESKLPVQTTRDFPSSSYKEWLIVEKCAELLFQYPNAAWGYEDFVPRQLNQSREFLSPVRIFSMLTFYELIEQYGRVPFTQMASVAKTTTTDERLKMAGLYRAGIPHAVDAARHATTFLRRARADSELRAQAWPHVFGG